MAVSKSQLLYKHTVFLIVFLLAFLIFFQPNKFIIETLGPIIITCVPVKPHLCMFSVLLCYFMYFYTAKHLTDCYILNCV